MTKRIKPGSARSGLTKPKFTAKAQNARNTNSASSSAHADQVGHVAEILRTAGQPLTVQQLAAQVRATHPHSTDATRLVRTALETLFQAVPVSADRYGWFTNLLAGNTIRHPLTGDEAIRGYLLMDELEHAAFFPEFFQFQHTNERIVQVELFGGPTIPGEAYIERKTWSLYLGPQFARWIEQQGGEETDDLLILVNDAAAGRYTLRLHPREIRNNSKIHSHNMHTALLAEDIVRRWRTQADPFPTWHLAAALVGHGMYATNTPPDDLHCVLHQYSLLHYNGTGYVLKRDDTGDGPHTTDMTERPSPFLPQAQSPDSIFDMPAAEGRADPESTESMDALSSLDRAEDGFADEYEMPEQFDPPGPGSPYSGLRARYDAYLDRSRRDHDDDVPLSIEEFGLLDSELQALAQLEERFGYLLAEQKQRQQELLVHLLFDHS